MHPRNHALLEPMLCRKPPASENSCVPNKYGSNATPVDRLFLYRAVQLQPQTDSRDHGNSSSSSSSSSTAAAINLCCWFELAIFRDKDVVKPPESDDQLLPWRSHGNRTDLLDTANSVSRHFGEVFD